MGRRNESPDVEWEPLSKYLPSAVTGGRPRADDRAGVQRIACEIRAGAAWREVPARYGSWQSLYTAEQQASRRRRGGRGGRPSTFDKKLYKRRNVVERRLNRLKQCRSVATRYD